MPTDPLLLECFCGGDSVVQPCSISEVRLFLNLIGSGEHQPIVGWSISYAGGTPITGTGTGLVDISLTPLVDWLTNWNSIAIEFWIESTAVVARTAQPSGVIMGIPMLFATFQCTDPTGSSVVASGSDTCYGTASPNPDVEDCDDDVDHVVALRAVGNDSNFVGLLFKSSPLNSCTETPHVVISNFLPNPTAAHRFLLTSSDDTWCLCASGGTPPYKFFLADGALPCGQTLNQSTGCVEGAKTDSNCEPSNTLTFQVQDAGLNVAMVTCSYIQPCGVEEFGNDMV